MVAGSTLLGLAMAPRWGTAAVDLLYLPAVLGAAVLGGRWPALFAALASALAYNFFFTAPHHTFRIQDPADVVTVIVLFMVAVVASQLAASVRRQARIAAAHAARNATIAGLARRLLSCTSEQEIADVVVSELGSLFECNAVLVRGPSCSAADRFSAALQPDAQRHRRRRTYSGNRSCRRSRCHSRRPRGMAVSSSQFRFFDFCCDWSRPR